MVRTRRLGFLADTHGLFEGDLPDMDYLFLLGDHTRGDVARILEVFPKERIFYVPGNHDTDIDRFGLNNIHGRLVTVNGVRVFGMGYSHRYKKGTGQFTQKEAIDFLRHAPKCDILATHDTWYSGGDPAHCGLKAIRRYAILHRLPLHIHGHLHTEYEKVHLNGTREISLGMNKIMVY